MSVLLEELQQAVNRLLSLQHLRIRKFTLANVLSFVCPKFLDGKAKKQVTPTDESVSFKKKPQFNLFRSWGNLAPLSSEDAVA